MLDNLSEEGALCFDIILSKLDDKIISAVMATNLHIYHKIYNYFDVLQGNLGSSFRDLL